MNIKPPRPPAHNQKINKILCVESGVNLGSNPSGINENSDV